MRKVTRLILIALAIAVLVAIAAAFAYQQALRDRILPGVIVEAKHIIDLGGLTLPEAVSALTRYLPPAESHSITLSTIDQTWQMTWAHVGQHYDVDATAQAAFALGRNEPTFAQIVAALRAEPISIEPIIVPADPAPVTTYLRSLATYIDAPPVDAQFTLNGGNAIAIPGQPGQALDVEANAARVLAALADGTPQVELVVDTIPPDIAVPEPALSQAQAWLAQPFTLVVDDPLIFGVDLSENPTPETAFAGYHAEFVAPPERVATWFEPRVTPDAIKLSFVGREVRAWLEEIVPQIGDDRLLDVGATVQNVLSALYDGRHHAEARIHHPERLYVVQPGDTLSLIAYNHFIPRYQIERANPGINPGAIDVGQEIVIPSVDVLLPYPLVPGKRIEISLPEQTMRVFENDTQIYTYSVSTGISRTPTIPGQFQILFKEEDAFAKRWSLDMPYFMGVYEEDEGFFNGIHELPITDYGTRLSPGVLGHPASFGCIIVDEGDAKTLFDWAELGTLVRIVGYAPGTPSWQQTLADLAPIEGESDE